MKKRILACVLTACMLAAMLPTMALAAGGYTDVAGHWCEDAINRWSSYGIINGVGNGLFDPNGFLTREQAAAIVARLLQLEETAPINFQDVPADAWYADVIAQCYAAGIINGTSTTTFGTGANLTRADMFTMFCRALGIEGQKKCVKNFDDANQIPAYAKEYTYALINLGIVSGKSETTLDPRANMTRAEMIALLDKSVIGMITADGEYKFDKSGIVLVIGDDLDIKLTGKGAVTLVVIGDDVEIDVSDMKNPEDVTIIVKDSDNVKIKASAGTTIVTMDATDVKVNGSKLNKNDEIVVGEKKGTGTTSSKCKHADRYLEYLDNEDGTHDVYCSKCDEYVALNEDHEYDDNNKCVCGAEKVIVPPTTGGSTTGGSTTGGSTTGGSTTGGSTTGGSTTGGSTTGGSTTGGSTTGGSTTGGSTTGGSTTGGSTTGGSTTGGSTTGGSTTGGSTTGGSTTGGSTTGGTTTGSTTTGSTTTGAQITH